MSVVVLRGGLQTTIQDLGRPGHIRYGVPEGGALDSTAMRVANMLVGNERSAAGIEMTIDGAHLLFEQPATIAICGADMSAAIGDTSLPQWRVVNIDANATVQFGHASGGARTYVAIAGGVDVPIVLGGRGTNLVGGFGGLDGRRLHTGDRIELGPGSSKHATSKAMSWTIDPAHRSMPIGITGIRIVPTQRFDTYLPRLLDHTFTVSGVSDRMGLRLNESIGMHDESIVSEPTLVGAIQLPPDGCPMILMKDHQTTGGYPIIAYVATIDLPMLGQMQPGSTLRFEAIDVERARKLLVAHERGLRQLEIAIRLQYPQ
ncbi:MAG: biotin-dependent carboxyltransferase [bacterium]|nr:biotin-dependent carboxyltransferase [Candidatus Kapabacteria bacterium]